VRVEVYDGVGFVAFATTDGSGNYGLPGLPDGTYRVRVVSATMGDSDTPPAAGYNLGFSSALAEQTYEHDGLSGNGEAGALGGGDPLLSDVDTAAGAGVGDTHVTVAIAGGAGVTGVDLGFSYNLIVNSLNAGQGSLRQFLLNSNAVAGANASQFNIPSSSDPFGRPADPNFILGVAVIEPTTLLPTITDGSTQIDGITQTLNVGDTNAGALGTGGLVGVDGLGLSAVEAPEVQIVDGAANLGTGLEISAADAVVRGIAIYGFGNTPSDPEADIVVDSTTGALIEQNLIGASSYSFTDPGVGARSGNYNVRLWGSSSGTLRNNLIGFNAYRDAVYIELSTGWLIEANECQNAGLLDTVGDCVVLLDGSSGNTVRGNLLANAGGNGIDILYASNNNLIENNTVLANGVGLAETSGVRVGCDFWQGCTNQSTGNVISANVITQNPGAGVRITQIGNTGNSLTRNAIYDNGSIGIDLNESGDDFNFGTAPYVTPNDAGDPDSGANNLLNFPVIYTAYLTGGNLTVSGEARPGATVEFFKVAADSSGYGEGQEYLGAEVEGSGADSNNQIGWVDSTARQFTFTFAPGSLVDGDSLTATATGSSGNTSEFAQNITAISVGCTVVQWGTGSANNATSVSASYPTPPTVNNLLVAVAGNREPATVSPPAGWSVAISQTNNAPGTPGQAIFYKFAGPSEPTNVTVSGYSTSTRLGLQVYEYCDIDSAVAPLTGSTSGTGTAVSSGSVTTTEADSLILAGLVTNAITNFNPWTNGFAERADFINTGFSSSRSTYGGADRHVGSAGTYSTTATTGVSGAWHGQIVAFAKRLPMTLDQSAYRWFANQDGIAAFGTGGVVTGNSTSVGGFGLATDVVFVYVVGEETGPNWRIEKRRLLSGALVSSFDGDGIISGDPASAHAEDIAIDSTYMYVVGSDDGGTTWRIEKRQLGSGALDTTFGTSGVITETTGGIAEGISIDSTYMYVVGSDTAGIRVEKRRLDTGALETGFDGDGIITGGGGLTAHEIAIDSTYLYLAGDEAAPTWRIEKRRLDTGALEPAFNIGGIVSDGTGLRAYGVAIDSTYMYVGGEETAGATLDWRIEKRLLDTGALDATFGTSGVLTSAGGYQSFQVGRDSTHLYLVGDNDATPAGDWYIEKRRQDTGALEASFGSSGAVTSATASESAWDLAVGSTYLYIAGYDQSPDLRIEKRLISDGSLVQPEIDVAAPLANLNTPTTAPAQGTPFRLRLLLHAAGTELWLDEGNFTLQFAVQSGTCDAGFAGESYADVTGATAIRYYNNAVAVDGWALTPNANDPTHGADPVVAQTYEEAYNDFSNAVAAYGPNEDGLWDFALVDSSAPASTTYCFRVVHNDGTVLDAYSAIAEIATAP
jgi:parallel beta-helix repeat protein